MLPREISGIIGLVGGLIDMIVGSSILQQPMHMTLTGETSFAAYAIIALGAIVLLTGVCILVFKTIKRFRIGLLMIGYGLVMLVLGGGMIGRFITIMTQGSSISGVVMIVVGITMLYSGYDMSSKNMCVMRPTHNA